MHRVLVVGVGSIGERHLRCFLQTGRAIVGFCEVSIALRDRIAAAYPDAKSCASLDDALKLPWDAAVIATPANTHIPIAKILIEHGLHVLIEKPLSTTTAGICELQQLAQDCKLLAGVAYVHRTNPALGGMRKAIESSRFGKPLEVAALCGQHFPTFRPAYREIYYADRSRGGGAIQDALTHSINAAEWLVGPTTRVIADAEHLSLPGVTVEDTVHVTTRHGRIICSFALNQFQQPTEVSVTVVCEKSTLRYEPLNSRWRWITENNGNWNDETHPPAERDAMFISQANAFMNGMESREPLLCTLEQGLQTLKVNLAMLQSAETDTWVEIAGHFQLEDDKALMPSS